MTRGDGLFHEGSPRAEKIEKEESNAALEQSLKIAFITSLGSVQTLKTKAFNRFLFSFVSWPRTETSTEKWYVTKPRDKSATNGAYFPSL